MPNKVGTKLKEYFTKTPASMHIKRTLIALAIILILAETGVLVFILAKPKFKSIFVAPDKENTVPLESSTLDNVLLDIHKFITK